MNQFEGIYKLQEKGRRSEMRLLIIILVIGFSLAGILAREITISAEANYDRQLEVIEVEVTGYSPSRAQTDSNPFQTASTQIVTPKDLNELLYVAVSRDLLAKFTPGAPLEYGDKIYLEFTVIDTMNKRIENTIDLFFRNQDLARKFGRQNRTIIVERR